jgi:hypothetical protein
MASPAKGQEGDKASAPARKTTAPKSARPAKGALEERIKQRAYELWEAAGRPHGQDAEHWARAERELTQGGAGRAPARSPNGKASNGAAGKAKPSSASAPAGKPGPAKPQAGAGGGRQAAPGLTKKP